MTTSYTSRTPVTTSYSTNRMWLVYLLDVLWNYICDVNWNRFLIVWAWWWTVYTTYIPRIPA